MESHLVPLAWALGELFVALGRATLWVRTRRYDTDAKDGAARHVAALEYRFIWYRCRYSEGTRKFLDSGAE